MQTVSTPTSLHQAPFSPTTPDGYVFPRDKLTLTLRDASKIPLVMVACGSYSPITYLHLRMFEMARDHLLDHNAFELVGGYFSPVSDAYGKHGLAPAAHRIHMCELAVVDSTWLMVDRWEPLQQNYVRTAKVLDHFDRQLNAEPGGGILVNGTRRKIKVMLLAGGDLIESFAVPKLWDPKDLHGILGDFGCIIIERSGSNVSDFMLQHDILYSHRKTVFIIKQFIFNDISSTKVRLFVKRGMSIRYLVPPTVMDYIRLHSLYDPPVIDNP